MKRMILTATMLIGSLGLIQAQTNKNSSTDNEVNKKATKSSVITIKVKPPSKVFENRYMYKAENGQSATPTGHEATGIGGGGYSSLKKPTPKVYPLAGSKQGNAPIVQEDQREYAAKVQAATKTGQEAAPVNAEANQAKENEKAGKKNSKDQKQK